MEFTLNTRKVGDVVVVDMSGRLVEGELASVLRDTIRRSIDDGDRQFVLNFAEVSFINSTGLAALAVVRSWMNEYRGQVNLLHLTPRIRRVLDITHLVTIFETFGDETEAVGSLNRLGALPANHP